MKHNYLILFFLIMSTISFNIKSAADEQSSSSSSSSSSSRALSQPIHEGEAGQQRWFILESTTYVPGDRGTCSEKIDLDTQDHLAHRTFRDLIADNYKLNVPWILALIYYEQENGALARDYADGRCWHRYLRRPTFLDEQMTHPLYHGLLVGSPEYYTVEVKDSGLEAALLGTEKETRLTNPRGNLLRSMLRMEQDGATKYNIGEAYRSAEEWDKAIKWYEKAMPALEQENKPVGDTLKNIGVAYYAKRNWDQVIEWFEKAVLALQKEGKPLGFALLDIGSAYHNKENWDEAIEWLERAIQALEQEGMPLGSALNEIGFAHESKKHPEEAFTYYSSAFNSTERKYRVYSLTDLLVLFAQNGECLIEKQDQMRGFAQTFTQLPADDPDMISYRKACPERYVAATEEAERLLANAASSSSSEPDASE